MTADLTGIIYKHIYKWGISKPGLKAEEALGLVGVRWRAVEKNIGRGEWVKGERKERTEGRERGKGNRWGTGVGEKRDGKVKLEG